MSSFQGAILQCVHMPRVNLEGASLKGCSMDERLGVSTNMEGERGIEEEFVRVHRQGSS